MRNLSMLLCTFVCTAAFLGAASAVAQDAPAAEGGGQRRSAAPSSDIEELVVHAGESESAADFKAGDSIASFGAEDLAALGAQSVADIANFTPNLEIVTTGSTTPTFFIRGVGLNDFNANSTGAVAIYQDDVPINAPALQLGTLFDVADVNVLRGPQATGQARNASAGAIKIYGRKPSGQVGGYLQSEFGNYDSIDLEGAVEAPVYEDILLARVAFRFSQRDGYARNDCGNAPPRSERGISTRIDNTDPFDAAGRPISICGEKVDRVGTPRFPITTPLTLNDGISPIREGLPTRVNDLGRWAARATLLFQPTLDSEWLAIGRISQVDQLTRLGQAIGTQGAVFDPACLAELEATLGRPPRPNERNQSGCRIERVLGGIDAGKYQAPEIKERLLALNPCLEAAPLGTVVSTGLCPTEPELFAGGNNAALRVAQSLVDLDSNPNRGQWNRVGPTRNDVWGVSLKGDTVFGDSLRLLNVTSFDTYDRIVDNDLDNSPNPLFEILTDDEGWQFVQTVDLGSEATESFPISWHVGGWYLREALDVHIENTFLPERTAFGVAERDYRQQLHSAAGYISASADFWKDFTLDVGFRYNWEHKKIDYLLTNSQDSVGQNVVRTWQAPTGSVRLTYRFREDTYAFWKYTRGWKPGTFNATSSQREGVTAADPEEIDAFEVGLNGSWFDGRLNGTLSLFHYNYSGYQIFIAQQTLGAQPEFVIINANNAEVTGAEVGLVARPLPGLQLEANISWLDSQFLDFVQRQQGSEQRGGNAIPVDVPVQNAGNPLLNSPRYKVSLTAEQIIPLGRYGSLTARWDGAWTADTNYDATGGRGLPNSQGKQFLPDNTIGQRAYWLHNLRVTYKTPDGAVELAGWVRNLTDVATKSFAFDASNFNGTTIYFVSEPRTYGMALKTNF